MIILINEDNHLERNKKNSGIFRGLKIKLGYRISKGLDCKLVNLYRMIILINEDNHLNEIKRMVEFLGLEIKLGYGIFEGIGL